MARVQAEKGTPLWGMNKFRSDALSQLLNDLMRRERDGLEDHQCDQVKEALGTVCNVAASVPDGSFFRRAIWQEIQDFLTIYERWNSHESEPDCADRRKEELKKLRAKRHKIARRVRKNQYILQNELDLKLVSDMYGAFDKLSSSLPDIFRGVGKAVTRYETGKAADTS